MYDKQYLCGIDESGRGPLAGPLVIAGVVLYGMIKGVMDSKKLSEKKEKKFIFKLFKIQDII